MEDLEIKPESKSRKAASTALQILSGMLGGGNSAIGQGLGMASKKTRGRPKMIDNAPQAVMDLLSNPNARRATGLEGIGPPPPTNPMILPGPPGPPQQGPQMGAPNMMPQGMQDPRMIKPPMMMG